jgi:hypothetical protein
MADDGMNIERILLMDKRKVMVYERICPHGRGNPATITEVGSGLFHCWGISYDERDNEFSHFTVAIVEMEDGTVRTPLPFDIKFIDVTKG